MNIKIKPTLGKTIKTPNPFKKRIEIRKKKSKVQCLECDGIGKDEKGMLCSVCRGTGYIEATIKEEKSIDLGK